LNEHALVQFIH